MRPRLSYIALLQHDDDVGIVDGAQPMRDEDGCALLLFDEGVNVG